MVSFEEKVLQAYPKKINEIAEHLSQDEKFRNIYKNPSKEEIIAKLNEPSFNTFDDGGVLTYCNHEFDDVHVIDLEFEGVLESFSEVSIDG